MIHHHNNSLKAYRRIVLLLLAAFMLHVGLYEKSYWVSWIGGVAVPVLLLLIAVYLMPKRPWQR